ncbi:MAG TPA: SRPBCC family protein [Nocardioidaceae bacterium]|nr:SRPBCC family protein [Nocardioidaceae bacterium]
MTSIHLSIPLSATPDRVWAAVRAVGSPHIELSPGFVTACELTDRTRTVTFANGAVARELIVDVDDERRRLAYAVIESGLGMQHHHAVMQVEARGAGTQLVWTVDVLPDEIAPRVRELMSAGAAAITQALA